MIDLIVTKLKMTKSQSKLKLSDKMTPSFYLFQQK